MALGYVNILPNAIFDSLYNHKPLVPILWKQTFISLSVSLYDTTAVTSLIVVVIIYPNST